MSTFTNQEIKGLNREEIDKLKNFIAKLGKGGESCYLAQSRKYSFALGASKDFTSPWVTLSSATKKIWEIHLVFSLFTVIVSRTRKSKLLMEC